MPLTFAQLQSFELYFEPAAIQILTDGGFDVLSAFEVVDEAGNLIPVKDTQAYVLFDAGSDEGDQLSFQEAADRAQSVRTGWRGTLRVTHRVAKGDAPTAPGKDPGCYKQLCIQRGLIRALFLAPDNPFEALLPQYDFLSISLIQPDRRLDLERFANQATELFDIRFGPADAVPAAD